MPDTQVSERAVSELIDNFSGWAVAGGLDNCRCVVLPECWTEPQMRTVVESVARRTGIAVEAGRMGGLNGFLVVRSSTGRNWHDVTDSGGETS